MESVYVVKEKEIKYLVVFFSGEFRKNSIWNNYVHLLCVCVLAVMFCFGFTTIEIIVVEIRWQITGFGCEMGPCELARYKKYSVCGFFDGMPRLSCGAASNMMKFRCRWSFSSRMAATFPHLLVIYWWLDSNSWCFDWLQMISNEVMVLTDSSSSGLTIRSRQSHWNATYNLP